MKEPKFISAQFRQTPFRGKGDDFIERHTVRTLREYRRLFRSVKSERAIGEASVDNLYYYREAIPTIKRILGDVKIVIVLRNPIDRAFSAYKNMLSYMREDLTFEEGIILEEKRRRENWEYLWSYTDVGFYANQVKAYMDSFQNVKVCLFDDLLEDNRKFMRNIHEFLDVDPRFVPKTEFRVNTSGVPLRNGPLKVLFRATGFKGTLYKFLAMNGLPDDLLMCVLEIARKFIMKKIHMKPETRAYLKNLYREDILRLQEIIKRPLYGWLH
jgi:hypothetical protein